MRARRYALRWSAVVGLAGLVHPYLAAMVLPLAALSIFRELWHRRRLDPSTAAVLAVGLPALLGLEWWLSGLFGLGRGGGFDLYTLHPGALFNPLGRSRLLPSFPVGPGQYEGYGHLGLGVLALGALALALSGSLLVRRPRETLQRSVDALENRGLVPLALFCLGLAVFALGNTALFILEVAFFYLLVAVFALRSPRLKRFSGPPFRRARVFLLAAFIPLVTSTFRAPGRFIWPPVYLLVLALVVFVLKRFSARTASIVLLAALGLPPTCGSTAPSGPTRSCSPAPSTTRAGESSSGPLRPSRSSRRSRGPSAGRTTTGSSPIWPRRGQTGDDGGACADSGPFGGRQGGCDDRSA